MQTGEYEMAAEYAQAALESMHLIVGGFHPALQPYYMWLMECLKKAGDQEGADQVTP